jgi:hypothetical protein
VICRIRIEISVGTGGKGAKLLDELFGPQLPKHMGRDISLGASLPFLQMPPGVDGRTSLSSGGRVISSGIMLSLS